MYLTLKSGTLSQDDVYSVFVGASSKKTAASWFLPDSFDVIAVLDLLSSGAGALS